MTAAPQMVHFVTHPDVVIDPTVPVPDWSLSPRGRDRMTAALSQPWVAGTRAVWCSRERKARDGAEILALHLGLPIRALAALGENDRSATGYLPAAEFEAVVEAFFARPEESVRGWERAADAQRRIVTAIAAVVASSADCGGDIIVVSHGGVGTLLLCHLRGEAITARHGQPPNNGGNRFGFEAATGRLHGGWAPIDG
jgi:broad specificity phosphatase PhoE